MSQWTHITGGLEIICQPYEVKKNNLVEPKRKDFKDRDSFLDAYRDYREKISKLYYLPYPEEQFKISTPVMLKRYHKPTKKDPSDTETVLHVQQAWVYSLPRAKKYIKEAFDLLPQGEVGLRYALKQDCYDYTMSSWASEFDYPCLSKYYKDALNKLYYNDGHYSQYTYEDLIKYQKLDKACDVNNVTSIIIGDCSAQELQEGLEKMLQYFEEHHIEVEDGYLEWRDEYYPDYIFAYRKSRMVFDHSHQFLKLDAKTNAIVHSKTWVYKRDPDGRRDFDAFDIVELDGPYIPEKEDDEDEA